MQERDDDGTGRTVGRRCWGRLLGGVIVMRHLVLKGLGDAGWVGCCQLVGERGVPGVVPGDDRETTLLGAGVWLGVNLVLPSEEAGSVIARATSTEHHGLGSLN